MLNQEFIKNMKIRLEEKKEEVEKKIANLAKPEAQMDNPSTEDIAQDAADDILEESLLSVHKRILEKINEALEKIKNNTYGLCAKCAGAISEEDLGKEPWAEYCGECGE